MSRTSVLGLVAWGAALGAAVVSSGPLASAQGTRSQWDAVYTVAQAKRGEALYAPNCAPCHNWNLGGNEIGPALTGPSFGARWDGRSLADLLDYTQALMPQNSPGGLSRQQNADILAFVFQTGGAPAGKTEFPVQRDVLSQITYAVKTP